MKEFPRAHTIGIRRFRQSEELDAGRNRKRFWSDPEPTKVYGYGSRSDYGMSEPSQPNRDLIVEGLVVLAPPEVSISGMDRVVIPGYDHDFEVDGEDSDWSKGPFGFMPGRSIALKKAEN
ncbi:hypothetical protein ABH922_002991 [Rhodococcus sp. 27YEA15]|uniref:hypothetical protein n=1 Tax=Rhodococcus sp. 27YEA15 TaxID=3156259 RepID=UPI003C7C1BFD